MDLLKDCRIKSLHFYWEWHFHWMKKKTLNFLYDTFLDINKSLYKNKDKKYIHRFASSALRVEREKESERE